MKNYDSIEHFKSERGIIGEPYIIKLDILSSFTSKGDSAYEVALDNGFKGTEQEWLDSLKQPAVDAANQAKPIIDRCLAAAERAEAAVDALPTPEELNQLIDGRVDNKIEVHKQEMIQYIGSTNIDGGTF